MIAYDDIRDVHLEISSLCNAACPWCPRNFWGYPYNSGYPETNLTLDQARVIFDVDFLRQLTSLRINGNFGDIVMNPQGADIVEYFRTTNPDLDISVQTNGGARDSDFWRRLAKAGTRVYFALDGLQDTHHLYRQNTSWHTVIKNAQTVIQHGGNAIWSMIEFQHNRHQISQAQQLSRELGFRDFVCHGTQRDSGPVFDRHGDLVHVMGDYTGSTEFAVLFHSKRNDTVMLEDIIQDRRPKKTIHCETKRLKSIYVSATGDVSPCCYTGFYPRTYGRGQYHEAANQQLMPLIQQNNALEHPLGQCIQWFQAVEDSWQHNSYQSGRLVICDDSCGSDF